MLMEIVVVFDDMYSICTSVMRVILQGKQLR